VTNLAGWLRDPTGRYEQRYWNGDRWTEHVAAGGLQGTDPLAAQPARPLAARDPDKVAQERHERMLRSSRRGLIGASAAAAVIVGLVVLGAAVGVGDSDDDSWSGPGGGLAERACGTVQLALREGANGTRSMTSVIDELEDAAGDARGAANLNPKWTPMARAMVEAREELLAGTPGPATRSLAQNCGMG
jgi:hypothetical protein